MNSDLEAIRIKAEPLPGEGTQDNAAGRALAVTYVEAHPDEFTSYTDMTIEQVVAAVDAFRLAGMSDDQNRAIAWHLYKWAPQNIGGVYQPTLRVNSDQ